MAGKPDAVRRVEVSARTKPEDAFARKDPDSLSPKQKEIWYCRPYANSIAYQIREAIPGARAEQVRKVEQSEGTVLKRISGLMWLISGAALLAAGFAVSAAMATTILERQAEIGLMRSLGASKTTVALLFYTEAGLLAIFAGGLGYPAGSGLAAWLGARIFANGEPAAMSSLLIPVLFPVVVTLALLVAIAGSTPAIRRALTTDPSVILESERMSRLNMTGILRRSLIHRRARCLSALTALTVSAAVATALLTLYADLDAKLHKEFRSFGANIIVTAKDSKEGLGKRCSKSSEGGGWARCRRGGVRLCGSDDGPWNSGGGGGNQLHSGRETELVVEGGCVALFDEPECSVAWSAGG